MRAQHGSTAGYMTYALRALHARSSRRFSGAVLGGLLAAAAAVHAVLSCRPELWTQPLPNSVLLNRLFCCAWIGQE